MSEDRLTAEQRRYLAHLCQVSPDLALAYELSQNFLHLLRERKAEELNTWLRQAKESHITEFRSLANSIQQDRAAVAAACSLPWNQGQVEGQVNRLKWLKRQMYGRARFDLLRLRVLSAS
jgi:transposase